MANLRFDIDWYVETGEWAACSAADERCTIFQTPDWAEVIKRADAADQFRVIGVRFDGGGKLLLPLAQRWRSRFSRLSAYESMPVWAYGGPIVVGAPSQELISGAISAIVNSPRLGASTVTITTSPQTTGRFELNGGFSVRSLRAHVLAIDANPNAAQQRYSKNFRRDVRIAMRSGIAIRREHSIAALGAYYSLYSGALSRWGADATSSHPRELVLALHALPSETMSVWLADRDGVSIGGLIMLYKGATAYYWHGAFDDRYSQCMPLKALLDAAICDAAERRFERFDMMSSGGHQGVIRLKESTGAVPQEFCEFHWTARGSRKWISSMWAGASSLASLGGLAHGSRTLQSFGQGEALEAGVAADSATF